MDKKEIRKLIRARKKTLTPTMVQEYSSSVARHIGELLHQMDRSGEGISIGIYLSLPDELQTQPLIDLS